MNLLSLPAIHEVFPAIIGISAIMLEDGRGVILTPDGLAILTRWKVPARRKVMGRMKVAIVFLRVSSGGINVSDTGRGKGTRDEE